MKTGPTMLAGLVPIVVAVGSAGAQLGAESFRHEQPAHRSEVVVSEGAPELPRALERALVGQLSKALPSRRAACFAPDTPEEYVQSVTLALAQPSSLMVLSQDPPKHRRSDRWLCTATDGCGIDAGDAITLRWSYVPDGTPIDPKCGVPGESDDDSNLFAFLNSIYPNGFDDWHPLFVEVFERWAELTGISYVYEPNDDGTTFPDSRGGVIGVRGDVRIGAHSIDGNFGVLACNYFPDTGDMILDGDDSFYNNTSNNSLGLRNVVSHEHGHGIGLEHVCPIDETKLMEPFVTGAFDGPQHDDVRGGQNGYGDTLERNDTAADATAVGIPLALGDIGIAATSTDQDLYELSLPGSSTVTIETAPIGFSYLEGPQNANGTCSAGTTFDSSAVVDLAFQLLESDGATVILTENATGPGGTEQSSVSLGGGDYFVRVFGASGDDTQLYQLDLTGVAALTFTVVSTTNSGDANPGDGVCDAGGGTGCTLRAAFQEASALPGLQRIAFEVAGGGPHVFDLGATGITVTDPLEIDGTTDTGEIVIRSSAATTLTVRDDTTAKGITIE